MKDFKFSVSGKLIDDIQDLDQSTLSLIKKTKNQLPKSYSPYSKFKVSCGVLFEDNQVIAGTNQENVSYPICVCAEQVALSMAANLHPDKQIKSLAITAESNGELVPNPIMPCGACRQIICEHQSRQHDPIDLYIISRNHVIYFEKATDLLPFHIKMEDII